MNALSQSDPLNWLFSSQAIFGASVIALVCLVLLLVLCVPKVRVEVETKVKVEVK